MIVIMLGGKARVGKTTAANIIKAIAENRGMSPIILPFAKGIKDEAAACGLHKDTSPEEYRKFCQELGERKRNEDPDHWVNKFNEVFELLAKEESENLENPKKKYKERVIIVDDCRYMNELAYGRKIGAKQIFISSGGRVLEGENDEWRKHHSEDLANRTEALEKDYDQLFEVRVPNDSSMNKYVELLGQLALVSLGLIAESLTMCDCEVCSSLRQGRPVNRECLIAEIEELLDEVYKKKKKGKD